MWRRPWVMAIVLPIYTAVLAALATVVVWTIFEPGRGTIEALSTVLFPSAWELDDRMWWVFCGLPAALIAATQVVFLWPLRGYEIPLRRDGKPLRRMVVIAGFVASVMTLALLFAIGGLVQLFWSHATGDDPADIPLEGPTVLVIYAVIVLTLVGSWIVWSILLSRFVARRDANSRFDRIVGLLLAGTIVETLVILPVDIMLRRRTECYCGTGGFYSLCLSGFALLWLAGPGALLMLTKKRRRRAWGATHCMKCGYVKGPTPAEACPECGHAWITPRG